jgi:hypothetical protein
MVVVITQLAQHQAAPLLVETEQQTLVVVEAVAAVAPTAPGCIKLEAPVGLELL